MGKADYLVNFFTFLAEDVRDNLAELGYRSLDEVIGRFDLLERNPEVDHWKIKNIDLSGLLSVPAGSDSVPTHCVEKQESKLNNILDLELIAEAEKALNEKQQVIIEKPIRNTDRTTGAMLSGRIASIYGSAGLA